MTSTGYGHLTGRRRDEDDFVLWWPIKNGQVLRLLRGKLADPPVSGPGPVVDLDYAALERRLWRIVAPKKTPPKTDQPPAEEDLVPEPWWHADDLIDPDESDLDDILNTTEDGEGEEDVEEEKEEDEEEEGEP